ncbi:MAG: DNA polymerase/3'-5' exonuclease PolX [Candidatus Omnitrophica bacterium]|nr:DNA polymerase/3'-5' exonuclease PolX [Candidatus Omnitrophota bacterium]
MRQHEIAALFSQIADLLEFRGENPFRIRAYRRAAQNLESLTDDIERMAAEDRLQEIPGIGQDLAAKIREYVSTGAIQAVERLRREVPAGIFELLEIPGVGPKTAKLLYERLRITSVPQLAKAARAHQLCKLPGFQEKKEHNIVRGIRIIRQGRERMHLGAALALSRQVIERLREAPGVKRVEVAGSLRRMKETIGDLDLLAASTQPLRVMKALTTAPFCAQVLASGSTKSSIMTTDGVQVDVRVVAPESFGAAWQYFTGSKEHNVRLREMAVRRGLKINEYGVFRLATGARVAGRDEEDIYRALELPWIPPEIREDTGEIEAAMQKRLPRLLELGDIKGDFHVHTNRSDGRHPLEEVAQACKRRGYQYAVITDHSKSLKVAGGLTEAELRRLISDIRALNGKLGRFQLLTGSEVDILAEGRMDYPNEMLAQLDFVIGSIHSGFKQSQATITNRLVKAIRNPYVTMIAHPTGRLLGQREPYEVDFEAVFQAARETGTAMEINAYPKRLDLNDVAARKAHEAGVMLAVSTDTHSLDQLTDMAIGVGVARRAWLGPRDILNCLSRDQLLAWVRQKRKKGTQNKF